MSSLQNHPLGHRPSDVIAMWAGWMNRESMDTSQIIIQSVPRAVTDSSDPIHIWRGFRYPKTTTIGREELCPTTTSSIVKRSRRYQIPGGEVSLNTDHVYDCVVLAGCWRGQERRLCRDSILVVTSILCLSSCCSQTLFAHSLTHSSGASCSK